MATTKIILTQDLRGIGKKGDIVCVPSGHAWFLISQGKAQTATGSVKKQFESERKRKELKKKQIK